MRITDKKNSGIALPVTLLVMVIVVLLGQSMLLLTSHETRRELDGRLNDAALYVADAGVEKAVFNMTGGDFQAFTEVVGENTDRIAGEADVIITSLGGGRYAVDSTGYVPSQGNHRASRTIRAVIEISAGMPQYAAMSGGSSHFHGNIVVRGVIYSHEPITMGTGVIFEPDADGNVGIYCSDDSDASITIGNNFDFDPENQATGIREIRARGGIVHSGRIPGDVDWYAYDISPKTEPVEDVLFVDADAMIADGATLTNYDFGGEIDVVDGRAVFSSNTTINMNGGTYHYPRGIDINSNVTINGTGSFVLGTDGDTSVHAVDISANVGGDGSVNFIVAGGEWKDGRDVNISSNVDPQGIIQAPGDAYIAANVEMTGIFAVGGDIATGANVEFRYSEDVSDVPLKEGGTGGPALLSWREISP